MCSKVPHGSILFLVSECDDIEDCDVTRESRDFIKDVTNLCAIGTFLYIGYRLPIGHELLTLLVSVIFSIKVLDKQTHRHTDASTDNKGRLKLSRSRANNFPFATAHMALQSGNAVYNIA